jgi:hypothetical protein
MATSILPAPRLESYQIILELHPTGELIVRTPVGLPMDDCISILEAGALILQKRQEITIH